MGLWKGRKLVADRTSSYFKNYTVICDTPRDELVKEVTINEFNFSLQDKMHFYVRFTEGHNVASNKEGSVVTDNYPFLRIKYINIASGLIESTEPIPIKMSGEFVGENFVKENETMELVYWKDMMCFDCVNGDVIWKTKELFKMRNGITYLPKQMIGGGDYNNGTNVSSDIHLNKVEFALPGGYDFEKNKEGGYSVNTSNTKTISYDLFDVTCRLDVTFTIDWHYNKENNTHDIYWTAYIKGSRTFKFVPKKVNGLYYYDYRIKVSNTRIQVYAAQDGSFKLNGTYSMNDSKTLDFNIDVDSVSEGKTITVPFSWSHNPQIQNCKDMFIYDQNVGIQFTDIQYR